MLAMGALAMYCIAVAAVVRYPGLGLALTAVIPAIIWESPQAPRVAGVLGFTIYLDDVIVLVLAGALAVAATRGRLVPRSFHVATALLLLAFVGSFLAGAVGGDLGTVVVEARGFVAVPIALLWAASIRYQDGKALGWLMRRYATWVVVGLIVIAIYHGARYGLGGADALLISDSGEVVQTGRILTSGQALILGISALALLTPGDVPSSRWTRVVACLGLATLVLSQQRTATVAIVAGLVVIFVRLGAKQRATAIASASVGALTLAIAYAAGSLGSLPEQLVQSATSSGTYEGRTASWSALVSDAFSRGASVVMFGRPFGSGFGRFEGNGRWVEFSPHNWYVSVFLRAGLIGLILLFWLLVAALRLALRAGVAPWLPGAWVAVTVFGWAYSWPWYVLPLLVCGLAAPFVSDHLGSSRTASTYRKLPGSRRLVGSH
ncbi:O-antigen ligase family protein [Demequina gelatinilytica]|uniref:O-antigen ligase family protein n=1 Tax=Demequina gelatinilytica TaxID=1638980 RepID=UPI0012E06BB8|nr:hypothetical protein [Demequina gelatinilytica]